MIALASLPAGREAGLIAAQAILITASVVATYLTALAAFGRRWIAFLIALLIATDVLIAGYVRVVMTETLAVALALGVAGSLVAFMSSYRAAYLWLGALFAVALFLSRPDWSLLMLLAVPYAAWIAHRHRVLTRRLLAHAAGSLATVVAAVSLYCVANWAVNGYLGLSYVGGVSLLGNVMVHGMAHDAPLPYSQYAPQVESYTSPWQVIQHPPFNDANFRLAGDYATATVLHNPIRFARGVGGTAITSLRERDTVFLRIRNGGPFAPELHVLLGLDLLRYRAFVILPALALVWLLAALLAPVPERRTAILGLLGLMVLYGWVTSATGTYVEFERIRMATNPLATTIVIGTILLFVSHRPQRLAGVAIAGLDIVAIAVMPGLSTPVAGVALLALCAANFLAIRLLDPGETSHVSIRRRWFPGLRQGC